MPSNSGKFLTNPAATAGVGSLTIPEFLSGVRTCLLDGKSNELVTCNILHKEISRQIKTSEDDQIVGKMIIKAYPCLEWLGVHPWVSIILICKHCISFSSINAIFKYTKSIHSKQFQSNVISISIVKCLIFDHI